MRFDLRLQFPDTRLQFPELESFPRFQRWRVMRKAGFYRFLYHQKLFWLGSLYLLVPWWTGAIIGDVLQYGYGFSKSVYFLCACAGLLIGLLVYGPIYNDLIERFRPILRTWLEKQQASI